MLKALIFDMDGVIVDSEIAWHEIEHERYSKLIPGWTLENHKDVTGLGLRDSHALFRDKYGLDMSWKDYRAYYEDTAEIVYGERCGMIPGCMALLEELRDAGIPLGLASSSPHSWIDRVFARFPIRDFFRCVVSSDDVGGQGKPAPDVYLEAVRRVEESMTTEFTTEIHRGRHDASQKVVHLLPSECASIEDSTNGLQAALRGGLFSIAFRNGLNDSADLSGAALELNGFNEENRDQILSLFK